MINPALIKNGIKEFLKVESSSGIVLGTAAVLAFIIANSSLSSLYFSVLDLNIFGLTLRYWINDGLMAIFFFVVGLEIKKELVLGHLNSPKKAALPMAAAIGGVLFPAAIYLAFNQTPPSSNGWGIPMATDIAFALGVLALFGKKVPLSLKIFLLAVAIVDDLAAILVIAFFYTGAIKGAGLGIAALALGAAAMLRFSGVKNYFYYVLIGSIVWVGFLYSGVHATIAGVLLGLLTPTKFPTDKNTNNTYSPLEDLVHKVHPWVSFAIMPIFAFANAGVNLTGVDFTEVIISPVSLGIILGLLIGKPLGVFLVSYLAVSFKLASLPKGLNWGHILGVGFLAGIGFTMSLFISSLALPAELEINSKTGIIFGSILSGLIGSFILKLFIKKPNP